MYLEMCSICLMNKITLCADVRTACGKEKNTGRSSSAFIFFAQHFQMDATECSEETHAGATHRRQHTHIYFHQPPHLEIIIHSDAISLWIKGSNMSPKPNCNISAVYKDRREGERARGSNWGKQIPTRFCLLSPFLSFLSVSHPPTTLLAVLRHRFQQ